MMGVKFKINTQKTWNQLGGDNHYSMLKSRSPEIAKKYIEILKDTKREDPYILLTLELPSGESIYPIWIKKEELEQELNG